MEQLDFDGLDETDFEEFCFGLLGELGFVNIDWRKGTGLDASPADSGRDIEAQLERTDVDGAKHMETWFIDAKHYKKGVPPEKIQGVLAWAHAQRPHTVLIIASNFLSNPCKDYLRDYEENTRPPFRIKYWERPVLERLTKDKDDFLARFLLTGMRSQGEILEAEQEFFDRVWYGRHAMFAEDLERVVAGEESKSGLTISPDGAKTALEAGERTAEKYGGPERTLPESDYEWGVFSGKLSALRWVLGDEWDMLDT